MSEKVLFVTSGFKHNPYFETKEKDNRIVEAVDPTGHIVLDF